MKATKYALLTTVLSLIFVMSCEQDEQLDTVINISVSRGTYIGVIHVNWDPVPDAQYYNIERKGPDGDWIGAGTVAGPPFDDYGFGLPDNKLVEGTRYTYRISSGSSSDSDSPYSDPSEEGWLYEIKPIQLTVTRENDGTVTLSWSDTNQLVINMNTNVHEISYKIKRRYENETEYTDIHTIDNVETVQNMSYIDNSVAKDKKAYYQIQGIYRYEYKNMDYGVFYADWIKDYNEIEESGGSIQVNYNVLQLSSLPASASGYGFVRLKNINNVIYAATIPKPALGNPVIYKLNGTSWQNISSAYPNNLLKNYESVSICGDGTNLWVGGISDSAYVYSYNSGWNGNLAKDNLGLTAKPDHLLIEYTQETLYALCDHDDKLEVYSYANNSVWNSEAILENSNAINNLGFKVFNGKLYAYYLITNTQTNSTLKIKHLEGSNWQTDFTAAFDNIMDVKVFVDNSGEIYFISDSQEPSTWQGGVFKVTSASSAQDLVSDSNEWLTFPIDIDYDDMDNPIVLYAKIVSQTNVEMHLAVYENGEWKEVAGDFSSHVSPADIESNNGLYYVFGDGNNLVNSYPATLKAIILNH